MSAATELASLRTKRRRIHANLRKLEPLVAGYHAKLAEVNAAIHAIDPQLWMPPRTYQRGTIFARNELPRLALAAARGWRTAARRGDRAEDAGGEGCGSA